MERTPEPELMDEAAQALAYAEADFDEPNAAFIARVIELAPAGALRVADLGCGPGDITLALAEARPAWELVGVDGAEAMLRFARPRARSNVRFVCGRLPDAPALKGPAEAHGFDLVVSNSLLHHLPDPAVLWETVKRIGRPGAPVLVADLFRPADAAAVDALVEGYAADAPPVLQRDFRASLHAAFEPGEVRAQLETAGLDFAVDVVSDRHLVVSGRLPA